MHLCKEVLRKSKESAREKLTNDQKLLEFGLDCCLRQLVRLSYLRMVQWDKAFLIEMRRASLEPPPNLLESEGDAATQPAKHSIRFAIQERVIDSQIS